MYKKKQRSDQTGHSTETEEDSRRQWCLQEVFPSGGCLAMTTSIQQQLPACRNTPLPIQTFLASPTTTDMLDTCLLFTLVLCFGRPAWSLCFYSRASNSACAGPPGAPGSLYVTQVFLHRNTARTPLCRGVATNRRLAKAPQIRAATAAHIYNPLATAPHGPHASKQRVEAQLESSRDC